MKESIKFVKEKLEYLHNMFPFLTIKYEFKKPVNGEEDYHLIMAVLSSEDDSPNHNFYDKEYLFIEEFCEKFGDEDVIFTNGNDGYEFDEENLILNLERKNQTKSNVVKNMLGEITEEQKEFTKNLAIERMTKGQQQILLNSTYGMSGDLSHMDTPEYKQLYNRFYGIK